MGGYHFDAHRLRRAEVDHGSFVIGPTVMLRAVTSLTPFTTLFFVLTLGSSPCTFLFAHAASLLPHPFAFVLHLLGDRCHAFSLFVRHDGEDGFQVGEVQGVVALHAFLFA